MPSWASVKYVRQTDKQPNQCTDQWMIEEYTCMYKIIYYIQHI